MCSVSEQAAKAVLRREEDFNAAGAPADHPNPRRAASQHTLDQRLPAIEETADRFHRNDGAGRALDVNCARRRADIDRQHVVMRRRPVAAQNPPLLEVDPGHLVMIETRAGKPGKRPQVDVRFIERVVAGDEARQHAGIGRMVVAANKCDTDAGHRIHAKALQDGNVAVAAADQNKILDDGSLAVLHQPLALPASTGLVRPCRSNAMRTKVSAMRALAFAVPTRLPETLEAPPMRRRCATGSSRMRRPARAVRICISRFHP